MRDYVEPVIFCCIIKPKPKPCMCVYCKIIKETYQWVGFSSFWHNSVRHIGPCHNFWDLLEFGFEFVESYLQSKKIEKFISLVYPFKDK
jgi:hypothetical protein